MLADESVFLVSDLRNSQNIRHYVLRTVLYSVTDTQAHSHSTGHPHELNQVINLVWLIKATEKRKCSRVVLCNCIV